MAPTALSRFALTFGIVGALTVVRLIGLWHSRVDLFFDESQYWSWSQHLAFGYFSKPPLLAWVISLSDSLCGDTEACVRSSSPLFYFGLALLTYAVTARLYDRRTAVWAAVIMALVPGVSFSSRIVSTDVPMLFFWALALLAYIELMRSSDWRWALLLGLAFGFGMLAKYAMIYFLLSIAIAALIDPVARGLLRKPQLWLALALGVAMIVPNVAWNAQNGFVTLRHTGGNISSEDGFAINFGNTLEFIGGQFLVAGPLLFGSFLAICAGLRGAKLTREDKLMVAFAAPPILLVTVLSVVRHANANWAATGIVALTIVSTAVLLRRRYNGVLIASLAIGAIVQVALLVGDVMPYRLGVAALGPQADFYHRTLGWRALADNTDVLARRVDAKTVIGQGRPVMAALVYYMRNAPWPVLSWPDQPIPETQFDLTGAIGSTVKTPALFVTGCPVVPQLNSYFDRVDSIGWFDVATGPHSFRRYFAFVLDRQSHPTASIPLCIG